MYIFISFHISVIDSTPVEDPTFAPRGKFYGKCSVPWEIDI